MIGGAAGAPRRLALAALATLLAGPSVASAPDASRGDFAGRVVIGGGRAADHPGRRA